MANPTDQPQVHINPQWVAGVLGVSETEVLRLNGLGVLKIQTHTVNRQRAFSVTVIKDCLTAIPDMPAVMWNTAKLAESMDTSIEHVENLIRQRQLKIDAYTEDGAPLFKPTISFDGSLRRRDAMEHT